MHTLRSMVFLAGLMATAAHAAPVGVDGVFSLGEYGAASASVGYDAGNTNTFPNYSNTSNQVAYDIYLKSSNGYLYGFLSPRTDVGGSVNNGLIFANLYFDLNPAANNGSDLGFETNLASADAFIPGVSGNVATPDIVTAFNTGYEFAIPDTYFTDPIAGLNYYAGQTFPTPGDNPDVVLRISQSLGFTPIGGSTYGVDRLGRVALQAETAVPEPVSMALLGAGLLSLAAFRRRSPAFSRPG